MKKLLVAIGIVLGMFFAKAQEHVTLFSKGNKFITGTLGYSYDLQKNYQTELFDGKFKKDELSIKPGFGYFISDDFALGGTLGYKRTSIKKTPKIGSETKETYNTFSADPFVRKYFYVSLSSFAPYVQLDATFGWNKKTHSTGQVTQSNKDEDTFIWGANLRPGFSYKISPKVALDATIGKFGYDNKKDLKEGEKYEFGFKLNDVKFGVLVFL